MQYTIDGSFSVEVTVPGEQSYSSVKHRAALTIGQVVEADSPEAARDIASLFLAQVAEDTKLALIAQAPGTQLYTDESGVVQVGLAGGGSPKATAPAPSTDTAPAPTSSSTGSFTPLSHGKDRYTVEWNGKPVTLFDNRATKTGRQPDFKIPDLGDDGAFWLEGKNGPNRAALALQHQVDAAVPA